MREWTYVVIIKVILALFFLFSGVINTAVNSASLTDTFPTRITNIYFVNTGLIVKFIMNFAKVLFKSKIIKRVRKNTG